MPRLEHQSPALDVCMQDLSSLCFLYIYQKEQKDLLLLFQRPS